MIEEVTIEKISLASEMTVEQMRFEGGAISGPRENDVATFWNIDRVSCALKSCRGRRALADQIVGTFVDKTRRLRTHRGGEFRSGCGTLDVTFCGSFSRNVGT